MQETGFFDIDQAKDLFQSAMNAVSSLCDGAVWKIDAHDFPTLGQESEILSRSIFAVNVYLAGEVDTKALASQRSCPSTAALLQQALLISLAETQRWVKAARTALAQGTVTGAYLTAVLPVLSEALDAGALGSAHVRGIVATVRKLPYALPAEDRDLRETFLVDQAGNLDPGQLQIVIAAVLDAADPDGTLDESDAKSKMEFSPGSRNIRTGLTGINGQLDDHGVDVMRKAIDALDAPQPAVDSTQDPRPAATRRAHALVSALEGFLAAGGRLVQRRRITAGRHLPALGPSRRPDHQGNAGIWVCREHGSGPALPVRCQHHPCRAGQQQ